MASNSILTNPEALVALRNLERTNNLLANTQNRVSTGLKVTGAIDDASNFAIAQGIRGDIRALGAVNQGLNNAKGIAKVAIAGTTAISDLLQTVRQKLTELSNEGITSTQRSILVNDFTQLLSQAANFIDNAVFNGVNLLDTTAISPNINTLSNINGGTLTLTAQDLRTTVAALAAVATATGANSINADSTGNPATNTQAIVGVGGAYTDLESVVNTALGSLGAEARALELQTSFLSEITDATEEGLGNIVDAEMARESARLTALQVRQQLGTQVLSIANQSPQILLSLFQ